MTYESSGPKGVGSILASGAPVGYRRTEMGLLPEEWRVARLGSVVAEPASYGLNAPSVPRSGSLPTYIRITDIGSDGRFAPRPPVSVDNPRSHEFLLSPGDLVFARTGASVGKSYLYNREDGPLVFAGFLVRVTPDRRRLLPEYLAQYAHSARYWQWVTDNCARSGQPGINAREYGALRIPLPPLAEQLRIAAVLATWDRVIELVEHRLGAARDRKHGLMQALLTGEARFPEFGGEPWRKVRLGKLFTERVGRGGGDRPLLAVTRNEGVVPQAATDRRDTSNANKAAYKHVHPGDICYNSMRMWQGASALSRVSGLVSPAYTVTIPGPDIGGRFAAHLFKLTKQVHHFQRYSQGMTSDTWNLKFPQFAQVPCSLPSLPEQRRIAAVLDTADTEIALQRDLVTHLRAQKRSLLEQLLTGTLSNPATPDPVIS